MTSCVRWRSRDRLIPPKDLGLWVMTVEFLEQGGSCVVGPTFALRAPCGLAVPGVSAGSLLGARAGRPSPVRIDRLFGTWG